MTVTCNACGEECRVLELDFGIGAYEYWGFKGVDKQLHRVSACCEADFTDHREEQEDDPCPF